MGAIIGNRVKLFPLVVIRFFDINFILMLSENFMRIAEALDVPLSYLMYENLNQIPITERILNILNNKSGKQKEYLLHMLEEMSFGLDKL